MKLQSKLGGALSLNVANKMFENALDDGEDRFAHDQDVKPFKQPRRKDTLPKRMQQDIPLPDEKIRQDLQLQEKAFNSDLSALPRKWEKEIAELERAHDRYGKRERPVHRFDIDNIADVQFDTIKAFNKWVCKQGFTDGGSKSLLIDPKRINEFSNEWDGKQQEVLKKLIKQSAFDVCIFQPLENFPSYSLSFCEKNLSLLKMTKKVKGFNQN